MRDQARLKGVFGKYHAGLAYQSLAPTCDDGQDQGKISNHDKPDWFDRIIRSKPHPDYKYTYDAWHKVVKNMGYTTEVTTVSPLLLGIGQASAVEVGLTIHPTWGVPYIPGSALKGLLSHYLMATYGPESLDGIHPYDQDHPEKDRAAFQGVTWQGTNIKHGPGVVYRAIFGAPSAETDKEYKQSEVGPTVGQVIFHDALMKPLAEDENDGPYMRDVVNPHVSTYYKDGKEWPNDRELPIPVFFLSVRPKLTFTIALSGDRALQQSVLVFLKAALLEWGIGAKTRSGYGRMAMSDRQIAPKVRKTGILVELEAMLNGEGSQKDKLVKFETEFLDRFRESHASGNSEEINEGLKLCRKVFKSKKLKLKFKPYEEELS